MSPAPGATVQQPEVVASTAPPTPPQLLPYGNQTEVTFSSSPNNVRPPKGLAGRARQIAAEQGKYHRKAASLAWRRQSGS